ncbi:hypothetical protein YC2023_009721 [Brassica napus]
MNTAQGGVLVNQLDQTEVFMSDHASLAACDSPSDHSVHADNNFPLDCADQNVCNVPSDHPDRTACTGDCADDLASLFDPNMDLSFGYFSKARILKLSKDLGHVGTQLVRSERPAAFAERPVAHAARPAHVLILSALNTASSDESGQESSRLLE